MKKLIILIFMAFAIKVSAQRVDYTKIIAPYDSIPVVVYIEKLVSVAWENYPKNHSYLSKKNEAIENVKQARNSWMNNLNLFTSFNSYNLSSTFTTSQVLSFHNIKSPILNFCCADIYTLQIIFFYFSSIKKLIFIHKYYFIAYS